MTLTLFPYQIEGAKFLSQHDRAGLFDEMGVGKTARAASRARCSRCVNCGQERTVSTARDWRRPGESVHPLEVD